MSRNRKIFLVAFAVFVAFLVFLMVDISRRTTPPWKKKGVKEAASDSAEVHSSPKSATQQP